MKAAFVASNAAISEKRFLFTKKLFAFTMEIYELIEKKVGRKLAKKCGSLGAYFNSERKNEENGTITKV